MLVHRLLSTTHDWLMQIDQRKDIYCVFFDLQKAFDSVSHRRLIERLAAVDLNSLLLSWLHSYISERAACCSKWEALAFSSCPIRGPTRLSFGATSIPDICQLYFLNPTFRKHKIPLYADDMLIYKPISTSSNYKEVQEDINIIFQWSVENLLTFNAAKCKCMLLSKKRTTIDSYPTMMLNDQPMEIVQQYKYLGLLVSSNLSWTPHIRSICNKARRILGLIYFCYFTTILGSCETTFRICSSGMEPISRDG